MDTSWNNSNQEVIVDDFSTATVLKRGQILIKDVSNYKTE